MIYVVLLTLLGTGEGAGNGTASPLTHVVLETSHGEITLELDAERAPGTVASFIEYVESGFYNGTIFHRVIPGFMIQGGGFTEEMAQKPTGDPIRNEADNGLRNRRGTIAMARTGDPHSTTSQFFINHADNPSLDHTAPSGPGWGYAVFGRVVAGMEVVDEIARVATGRHGSHQNVPRQAVVLERARVAEAPAPDEGGEGES